MKKDLLYCLILITVVELFSPSFEVLAQGAGVPETRIRTPAPQSAPTQPTTPAEQKDPTASYTLLAPLPEIPAEFNTEDPEALNKYFNIMIKIFLGLCSIIAVMLIVVSGVEYSISDLTSTKAAAINRIRNAILGLLLALGSYVILYEINSTLVDPKVNLIQDNSGTTQIRNKISKHKKH